MREEIPNMLHLMGIERVNETILSTANYIMNNDPNNLEFKMSLHRFLDFKN